jgi:hypothetical protein
LIYRFGDLTLASEEPFSQLPAAAPCLAECWFERTRDVDVRPPDDHWDHHWRSPGGGIALSCARDGDRYRLGMPGLATFAIDGRARTITCRARPDLPPATLEHLVIDQVLPRVLTHRGRLVLHAGCVVAGDGAIAFLGDSGSGKSTLCGAFGRAGDAILGDDGIVVRPTPGRGFEALATYPGLRLLPGPLASLFDEPRPTLPVSHDNPKRRVDRDAAGVALTEGPARLRAIYLLDTAARVEIAPLVGRDAFVTLVRSCFPMHLDDAERSGELFGRIGALIDAVPVRRLSYPRDYDRLPAVREALLEDCGR